jgi:hypothetical protein
MQIFLSAFDDVPDPRASNARHDLGELLVIAFVSVLCGSASCAEMAAFGRAKECLFRDFLKLKHAIPSHDTFSEIFRVIDPKALDAAFGKVLADVAALLKDGDVIAIDGKALRGARDKGESARTRMMVSAYASRLRRTQPKGQRTGQHRRAAPPRSGCRPTRHIQRLSQHQTQARWLG